MAKFRFNIFFFFALVCILALLAYLWLFFLPYYEESLEYDTVRNLTIVLSILILVSAVLTFLQMIEKDES